MEISSESLREALLEEISRGHLVGGQRLKISELSKRFGVSASPIREVLRQMQGEGFVDIHPNRGATIRQADASTIQNIFEVLQLLEPYFVTWFAENSTPESLDELERIQDQIRTSPNGDMYRFRCLDADFHGLISRHHYNSVAAETWKKLRTALNVHGAPLRIGPTRLKNIIEEHDALIATFRAGDPVEADRVIRKHVQGSFVQMSQQMRLLAL